MINPGVFMGIALALAGCSAARTNDPGAADASGFWKSGGNPSVTVPSPSVPAPASGPTTPLGLAQIHSPGIVAADKQLYDGECHARGTEPSSVLPDSTCTPGAIDPAVTQGSISSTICTSGWTGTVRPSSANTSGWKRVIMRAYGDTGSASGYELDHLVPLELGGANSVTNLWPEPGKIPNPKDRVENQLKDEVCSGQKALAEAQREIAANWTSAH